MGEALTVADIVLEELETMYKDQPTYNRDKMVVIVNKVIEEVKTARKYKEVGYSDEKIADELFKYRSNIYNLAEYDFAQFGAPHEASHSENSINRSWTDRNKLFKGIIPLAKSGK